MKVQEAGPWQTVLENTGLVRSVAKKVCARWNYMIPLADLVEYGWLGAFDAVVRFDPNKGTEFSSFAYGKIYFAMMDGAFEWMDFHKVRREKYGKQQWSGISHVSLDELKEEYDFDFGQVDSKLSELEDDIQASTTLKLIWAFLQPREKKLLYMYMVEGKNLAQIGKEFGISESRVCQLRKIIKNVATFAQRVNGVLE